MNYLIIIPAYNEEANIVQVLQDIKALRLPVDVLVIDDGSVDRTALFANKLKRIWELEGEDKTGTVTVVSHPCNLGYGAALQTGFRFAKAKGYRFLIQFDADRQHDPAYISSIIKQLNTGDSDIVIGSRYNAESTFKAGFLKKAATAFFKWMIARVTGKKVSDPTSGFRGVGANVFSYYSEPGRFPADFPDADMLIQMILKGYRVSEIPVVMRERSAGTSMHAGIKPVFYMFKILLSIGIVILRHQLAKKEVGA